MKIKKYRSIKNLKFNFQNNKLQIQTFITIMGGQNTKQIQGQSSVQINHPKFQNAKVSEQKGNINMITMMSIEQKEYFKWKQQLSILKLDPEYLLMPKNHQFNTKGFCGSTGTLTVAYQYFPYLLLEEIENRKKRNSKFQQCELWFLLFSLSAAQIEMKKIFDSKIGDIRPQNIFINQEGQIKVSCLHSWPKEGSNFQKTFEHQLTLISPEDMNKLELGGMDDVKNYQSEMFSIGMTVLSAAMLCDFGDVYDLKKMKFRYEEANQYLLEWRANNVYSQIFTAFLSNLCSFEPEKRLTQKQLWSWINKYDEEIKNKDDFFIEHAPIKIDKEIQQLRGESNINMLQDQGQGMMPPQMMQMPPQYSHQQQNIPFQQKSIVFPFMQGMSDPRFMAQQQMANTRIPMTMPPLNTTNLPMNMPPGVILSPRQGLSQQPMQRTMVESIHHNIPTAESMYTPIPAHMIQQRFAQMPGQGQFATQMTNQLPSQMPSQLPMQSQLPGMTGQLPPGVIQGRGIPSQGFGMSTSLQGGQQRIVSPQNQQFYPPNMMPNSPTNGNFVYTRRIIDPKNGGVVAQQRIGQDQYQRGLHNQQQPQEEEY